MPQRAFGRSIRAGEVTPLTGTTNSVVRQRQCQHNRGRTEDVTGRNLWGADEIAMSHVVTA